MIYLHQASGADQLITGAIDATLRLSGPLTGDDDGTAGALVPTG